MIIYRVTYTQTEATVVYVTVGDMITWHGVCLVIRQSTHTSVDFSNSRD